jgi:L-serine dehydratase
VLDAHREISENMARELRCTALGGLSVTPTSKAIEAKLCGGCGSGGCGGGGTTGAVRTGVVVRIGVVR